MRRHLTYANLAATLALVFSMRLRLQPEEAAVLCMRRSGWLIRLWRVVTLGLFTFGWRASVIAVTDHRV